MKTKIIMQEKRVPENKLTTKIKNNVETAKNYINVVPLRTIARNWKMKAQEKKESKTIRNLLTIQHKSTHCSLGFRGLSSTCVFSFFRIGLKQIFCFVLNSNKEELSERK